ncbi:hypothetical protein H2202_007692 [Exophiala xenobiotica]|nr:hypothetical protein H2202_007692 [Exophiala xenobiotica]
MVYKGPSRGCYTCRKRRVKCDETRPECGNCKKRKQPCPGYRDLFDTLHKDETHMHTHTAAHNNKKAISRKNPRVEIPEDLDIDIDDLILPELSTSASTSSSTPQSGNALILIEPSRNAEADCLAYFFANYVNIPRDPSTNIFIEHILPLYLNAPLDSALTQAANAVAINVTQMWMSRNIDSYLARGTYAKAVSLLKCALEDPTESKSDHTLAAVFLLDFYDSLNKRFVGFIDNGTHQQGAVALLRHRGGENFKTPTSQRLFTALRSRHISFSMQTGQKVMLSEDLLTEDTAILPSAKLDLINAELTDLHVAAAEGPEAMGMSPVEYYQSISKRALVIAQKLDDWRNSLPRSWQPVPIPASELHPSIRAAGVYGDTVDVYSSLTVSHVNNASRSSHVGALRLIALCHRELKAPGVEIDPLLHSNLISRTQEIVDRFCASVPYHLGNRTTLTFPHEHSEYPHVPDELRKLANYVDPFGNPVEMTQEDHIRAAAAIGGFFVMAPLSNFLKAPALQWPNSAPGPLVSNLRPGQMDWIRGQMKRLQTIYGLPTPTTNNWQFSNRKLRLGGDETNGPVKVLNRQLWQV